MHEWTIDLNECTKRFDSAGYRQIVPKADSVYVKPIAKELASGIIDVSDNPYLKWMYDGSVRVLIGKIIPADGPKQTYEDRRRRLNKHLLSILEEAGWTRITPNRYRPPLISK
jgi:hypothetical protein